MSNSKKDTEIIFKTISNFISGLSEVQYSQLINGEGELIFRLKGLDNETIKFSKDLMFSLVEINSTKARREYLETNINKKIDLMNLCNFLNIPMKSRDNSKVLIDSIMEYITQNEKEIKYSLKKEHENKENLNNLANDLETVMDVNEARILLKNFSEINKKNDLIDFAKSLSVFPDKRMNVDEIIDEIVKTVVEAKIRSYKIRKKL